MRKAVLLLVSILFAAVGTYAAPTTIRILSPGNVAGGQYRAGNSYDILYDTVGTFRSRFRFQFGTSITGPWTDLAGATNVIDSNASSSIRRGQFLGGFRVPSVPTATGYIRMVLLNADGTLNEAVTDVNDFPFTVVRPPASKIDSVLKGSITSNLTLTRNKIYGLSGYVHVMSGASLTIEPGTVIFGDSVGVNSALIINRGAQIIANG